MVVPLDYYRSMFEKADQLSISWQAYGLDPLAAAGGATTISGSYDLPVGQRDLQLYQEIVSGVADTQRAWYASPAFFETGVWHNDLDPTSTARFLVIPNSAELTTEIIKIINLSMMTWDGSVNKIRQGDALGSTPSPQNPTDAFLKVFGVLASQITSDMSTGKWVGFYPILAGQVNDMLRQIVAGVGAHASVYTEGSAVNPIMAKIRQSPDHVRLINAGMMTRKIVEPPFNPKITMTRYSARRGANAVYYAADQVFRIDPNVTTQVRVQANGTPGFYSLKQPVPVTTIPTVPYVGPNSIYVVEDQDGFEASGRFKALGGSVSVAAGATPDELILTMVGPTDDPSRSYYLQDGDDNPALYISAYDGTIYYKQTVDVATGAVLPLGIVTPPTDTPIVDNPMMINDDLMYDGAVRAIGLNTHRQWTMDNVTFDSAVNLSTGSIVKPDEIVGSVFKEGNAWWRIKSLAYDSHNRYYTASTEKYTTVGDSNNDFASMTIGQYATYLSTLYGSLPTVQQVTDEPLRVV